jgi:zinc transport system substrate-binding protein
MLNINDKPNKMRLSETLERNLKGGIIVLRKFYPGLLVVVAIAVLLVPLSCSSPSVEVMAGSSQIASAVRDIADGKLEVSSAVPPGMCPGHYDVKPGDIEALSNSDLFIIHNWQQKMANITGLIEAANNPDLPVRVIDIMDAPMLPSYQIVMVDKISLILSEIYPGDSDYYQESAANRKEVISAKEVELKDRLKNANVSGIKVLCAEMQAGFIKWVGFDVIASYGRPEELSAGEMEELLTKGNQAGVLLVIDNLQSGGTENSEGIARDTGAMQVVISNFPGGFENTETWDKAVDKNIDLLLEALAKVR